VSPTRPQALVAAVQPEKWIGTAIEGRNADLGDYGGCFHGLSMSRCNLRRGRTDAIWVGLGGNFGGGGGSKCRRIKSSEYQVDVD